MKPRSQREVGKLVSNRWRRLGCSYGRDLDQRIVQFRTKVARYYWNTRPPPPPVYLVKETQI
jgi:hypothetical protein